MPGDASGTPVANRRALIDLRAIRANYRQLAERVAPARSAAVIKANAYGLGVGPVAAALRDEGCECFFVATAREGVELRSIQPRAEIYILEGCGQDEGAIFTAGSLRPVINTIEDAMHLASGAGESRSPCAIHIDTGMNRLGLRESQVRELVQEESLLDRLQIDLVMSHYACADDPDHPQNDAQLREFHRVRALLPVAPTSIANSSAAFMPARFHGDLARLGIALFGSNPVPSRPNPMQPVLEVQARVLQVYRVEQPGFVGYGATAPVQPGDTLITLALGYADGFIRALGNQAELQVAGERLAVIGRVSMDSLTLRAPAGSAVHLAVGDWVTVVGGETPLDELAARAGTLGYELLTGLGARVERQYSENGEQK